MSRVKLRAHPSQFNGVDTDISYQMMLLHDGARMRAYYGVIDYLSEKFPHPGKILDAGTGSGVWAIECAKAFPEAEIDAVDYHPELVELAKKQVSLWPELSDRINVIEADLTEYKRKKYDLIITELDGGVGNNEGAKTIFNKLKKNCLKKKGLLIPAKINLNIAPVEVLEYDILGDYLHPSFKDEKCHTDLYYLMSGLKSGFMAEEKTFHDYLERSFFYGTESLNFKIGIDDGKLTGFAAWFFQELLDISDSGHPELSIFFTNNPFALTTSWGQAYFPVEPFDVKRGDYIWFDFAEIITPAGPIPHYEWSVEKNGKPMGKYSNEKNQERRR